MKNYLRSTATLANAVTLGMKIISGVSSDHVTARIDGSTVTQDALEELLVAKITSKINKRKAMEKANAN